MQIVTPNLISGKKVLLRMDLDVAIGKVTGDRVQVFDSEGRALGAQTRRVTEDFKIKAGIPTLKLCIQNASKVIILGHLGRPYETVEDEKKGKPEEFSLKPVYEWLIKELGVDIEFADNLDQVQGSSSKIILLENTRFFHGEVPGPEYHNTCTSKTCDIDFTHKLAGYGDFYVNEAFSAYHGAASTTILPTLLPHAAGLRFAEEVRVLGEVREKPKKPFVAIIGGAKVEDKLPVIKVLAEKADAVLVGGKLVAEIRGQRLELPTNVMVGKLNEDGFDISPETVESWRNLILGAKLIVWNGPLGKFEDPKNENTRKVGEIVTQSSAETIVGGGDIIAALNQAGLLDKISFVSVGGGAMLKFLSEGTLETIKVLA